MLFSKCLLHLKSFVVWGRAHDMVHSGGQRTWREHAMVYMWGSEDIGGTCLGAHVEVRGHGRHMPCGTCGGQRTWS